MSDTVFTKVDYTLGALVHKIELGEIGLPDIQRPFVWKNSKVRDLFDSMYRGYPVGYPLLWENGLADDRTIGVDTKAKPPRLVIVDGQQRLTSLYAVIKGVRVMRDNYESENIRTGPSTTELSTSEAHSYMQSRFIEPSFAFDGDVITPCRRTR